MDARLDRTARALLLLGAFLLVASALAGTASAKDLTVTLTTPAALEHNASFVVDVSVANDASGASGAPVEVQLYLDGNATGPTLNLGAMNSNTTATTTANVTALCGSHLLSATVDPNDAVAESNESNNNFTLPIVVQPVVNFTHALSGDPGEYTLTLTAVTEGCGPLDYAWDVDGAVQTGSPVDFMPVAGDIDVTLTASSPSNPTIDRSVTHVVTIPNKAPELAVTLLTATTTTGEPLALQLQYSDADGSVVSLLVDFGDGNTTDSVIGAIDYEYSVPGNYTVTVTVTDNLGATTQGQKEIEVVNQLPIAHVASFLAGNVGDPVHFNASLSSDPDGGPLTFTWDFGDGETGSGVSTQHTYTRGGNFDAKLTVTDQFGGSSTADITVQIFRVDSGGSSLVLGGIIIFVLALIVGYYLLVVERRSRPEGGDGGEQPPASGSGEAGGAPTGGAPDEPAAGDGGKPAAGDGDKPAAGDGDKPAAGGGSAKGDGKP